MRNSRFVLTLALAVLALTAAYVWAACCDTNFASAPAACTDK